MTRKVLLVASALGFGCEGSSAAPFTAEDLTPAMAEVFCAQMRRCCGPDEFPSAEWQALFENPACATLPMVQEFLDQEFNLARLRQSVQGGRATLDGTQARACVDALGRLSCPNWAAASNGQQAAVPDACRRMIKGTRPAGAACTINLEHECQSGSCSDSFPLQCAPAPTEGQACPSRCEDVFDCSARCADGLRCASSDVCTRNPAPAPISMCDGT